MKRRSSSNDWSLLKEPEGLIEEAGVGSGTVNRICLLAVGGFRPMAVGKSTFDILRWIGMLDDYAVGASRVAVGPQSRKPTSLPSLHNLAFA